MARQGGVSSGMTFRARERGAVARVQPILWRVQEVTKKPDGLEYAVLVAEDDTSRIKTVAVNALLDRSLYTRGS